MTTDSKLQSDVLDELTWRPSINAAHIGVAASNGIITLTGQVHRYSEKRAAEDAAKEVYGVKGIANDIKVELEGTSDHSDQDIAAAAVSALKWDSEVPDDRVKVVVQNGWITLSGTVGWQYQKDSAERCVRYLLGVIGVTNGIVIKPAAKWTDVKAKIEEAFRRNADLDARGVKVTTSEGRVTLTGTVSSLSERNAAVESAWSAPGVTRVEDELTISP